MKIKNDPALNIPANFRNEEELKQLKDSADVDKLRSLLEENEVVHRLMVGFHEESDGVLAATNRRIIYADKRFLTSKTLEYDYADVAAIVYASHLILSDVTLVHAYGSFTLSQVDKDVAERFIEFVGMNIGENYEANSSRPRVFKHRGDILELHDMPSQQEDV